MYMHCCLLQYMYRHIGVECHPVLIFVLSISFHSEICLPKIYCQMFILLFLPSLNCNYFWPAHMKSRFLHFVTSSETGLEG